MGVNLGSCSSSRHNETLTMLQACVDENTEEHHMYCVCGCVSYSVCVCVCACVMLFDCVRVYMVVSSCVCAML